MKRFLSILMILMASITGNSQIDLSCDASFIGVHPNVKISYPLWDKVIIGGSFGYNVTNKYMRERMDLVIGFKINEYCQVELDGGVMGGYSEVNPTDKKEYIFHYDIGMKLFFNDYLFGTLQAAHPGFFKIGFGVRLRPYKKLTIWDKQNLSLKYYWREYVKE